MQVSEHGIILRRGQNTTDRYPVCLAAWRLGDADKSRRVCACFVHDEKAILLAIAFAFAVRGNPSMRALGTECVATYIN